jgi:hypothetical protein
MIPSVYLETTIISYLAARPSRNLIVAANQRATRDWWRTRRHDFELIISDLVLVEIAGGDPAAARRRAAIVEGIDVVPPSDRALSLAREVLRVTGIPRRAARDAAHIALAATNGARFLLTWKRSHRQCRTPRGHRIGVPGGRRATAGHLHAVGTALRCPRCDRIRSLQRRAGPARSTAPGSAST